MTTPDGSEFSSKMTVEEESRHLSFLESFSKGKSPTGDLEESLRYVFEDEVSVASYKKCLTSILGLLGMHIDHSLVTYTLEHLSTLHGMLAKYPMLQKECTKVLVALAFSSTVPGVRLKASVALVTFCKRFAKQAPDVLKQAYQAFSKACHSVTVHTLPMLSLATNSLVELFAIHPRVSHAYSLKLLRALASQVQTALKHPSSSTIQALQSWKWVAPVRFFAKHLIGSKSAMQAPFIQMICAALTVKVSMNTLPFHFHLLTCISEAPFPIPSAIGALLHAASVLSQANSKQEHGKPRVLHLPTLLTVSDSETGTRSYHDAAVDEAFYLILKYLTGISTEASFPELSEGVTEFLRSMQTKNPRIKQHISSLAEKCASVCAETRSARLDYAPLSCTAMIAKKENELTLFLEETERKRARRARMALVGVVDQEEDVKHGKRQKGKTVKREKKRPKVMPIDDEEADVLEDLELSSDFE